MVPLTFTQWLTVNRNHGNNASAANIQVFYKKYVLPEVERLKAKAATEYYLSEAESKRKAVGTAMNAADFATATSRLNDLIAILNKICRDKGEKFLELDPVARYSEATWKTPEEAVAAMDQMAVGDQLATRKPKGAAPKIPGIKWSTAKQNLPRGLIHLIRDIRNASLAGGYVDERSQQQLDGKSITPKPPATLRSWHMNDQGALPDIAAAVPASTLHAHYAGTSQKPGNTASKSAAPIGYAEYTGCGIEGDAHNVKLVLDYTTNDVYVTVTHYQRWDKSAGPNVIYSIKDKNSGANSAWFYIDFPP